MSISTLNRLALTSFVVAAFLAGCGAQPFDLALGTKSASAARPAGQPTRTSTTYSLLHSFGGSTDGAHPLAGLVNVNATLYGTTSAGGSAGYGTVYSITSSGAESVIHGFKGKPYDGEDPAADLINVNGTLYGTTAQGGAFRRGTVYSIAPSGEEALLHSFRGGYADGEYPHAGLVNLAGTLYGTTVLGAKRVQEPGGTGRGGVYSITPSGTETVLHRFEGKPVDGAYPYAGLLDVNGTLYGTTQQGGNHGAGVVYSMSPSGAKEAVLYNFKGEAYNAADPWNLIDVAGTLYGTTFSSGKFVCHTVLRPKTGCGTVFVIAASGVERVLHNFGGSGDGLLPKAGLTEIKGTLYGTTQDGGTSGYGTVYSITRSGSETILHSFKGGPDDGEHPEAGLINVDGTLYGTTADGGTSGYGTVFSLKP